MPARPIHCSAGLRASLSQSRCTSLRVLADQQRRVAGGDAAGDQLVARQVRMRAGEPVAGQAVLGLDARADHAPMGDAVRAVGDLRAGDRHVQDEGLDGLDLHGMPRWINRPMVDQETRALRPDRRAGPVRRESGQALRAGRTRFSGLQCVRHRCAERIDVEGLAQDRGLAGQPFHRGHVGIAGRQDHRQITTISAGFGDHFRRRSCRASRNRTTSRSGLRCRDRRQSFGAVGRFGYRVPDQPQALHNDAAHVRVVLDHQDVARLGPLRQGKRQRSLGASLRIRRRGGEIHFHGGAGAGLAAHERQPARLAREPVHLAQAQAGAAAQWLGGEERVEHLLLRNCGGMPWPVSVTETTT